MIFNYGRIVKCPICKNPYRVYPALEKDQSACPPCVKKADKNMEHAYNKWESL